VLDVLLPRRCLLCGTSGAHLCAGCRGALPALTEPICARCGAPTAWPVARCRECAGRRLAFARARAAVAYDDDVRRLVRGWKEQGLRGLARDAAAVMAERLPRPATGVVTFVPPDRRRRLERGYHPAEQLARRLAELWSLPCEPLLCRTGRSTRQRGLALAARRRNVRGAFAATRALGGRVLLVDDVYTTGATAHAAASALRAENRTKHVEVLTFARTIRAPPRRVNGRPRRTDELEEARCSFTSRAGTWR
jgi:predicted amidophosphoribosyltransferase